jgi:hypothetical protein
MAPHILFGSRVVQRLGFRDSWNQRGLYHAEEGFKEDMHDHLQDVSFESKELLRDEDIADQNDQQNRA